MRDRESDRRGARPERSRPPPIIGDSPAMVEIRERISRFGSEPGTKLITGESGTGKGLVAAHLHEASPRREESFVVANSATLSPALIDSLLFGHRRGAFSDAKETTDGLFRAAHRGTLFLDEIADLPLDSQAKILRTIETGKVRRVGETRETDVDVELVTATNVDLEKAVEAGAFRRDLFERLNYIPFFLPPLRDRPGDIPLLTRSLLAATLAKRGDSRLLIAGEDFLRGLEEYPFPGNVRELEAAIAYAVIVCDGRELRPEHLPDRIRAFLEGDGRSDVPRIQFLVEMPMAEVRRLYFKFVWERKGGNISQMARTLQVDPKTVRRDAERYGLGEREER